MKQRQNNIDSFETDLDEFSLGFGTMDQSLSKTNNEYIFKIGSNFIQQQSDSQNDSVEKYSKNYHKFLKDNKDQRISQNQPIENTKQCIISAQKISKINNINQNFRMIVTIQQLIKQKIHGVERISDGRKKEIRRINKDYEELLKIPGLKGILKIFEQKFEERMEAVKWNRIEVIPKEKRQYFLGLKDKVQIHKRKFLQTLIKEIIKEFQFKKGLKLSEQLGERGNQLIKCLQEYVKENVKEISSQELRKKMLKIIVQEQNIVKFDAIKEIDIKRQENSRIHKDILEKIEDQNDEIQKFRKISMVDVVEKIKRLRQQSQDLFEFIPSKHIFSLLPSLKANQDYQQYVSYVQSFSKEI